MVSNVLCDRHGPFPQEGVLCCDHVREAIRSNESIAFDQFEIDICSDGQMLIEHMLCSQCVCANFSYHCP